jgi:hypothetical protein
MHKQRYSVSNSTPQRRVGEVTVTVFFFKIKTFGPHFNDHSTVGLQCHVQYTYVRLFSWYSSNKVAKLWLEEVKWRDKKSYQTLRILQITKYIYVHHSIEYQSVCPRVRIGTPRPPIPQASVPFPLNQLGGGGGGHTRQRATESQLQRMEKIALCLLCGADTVRQRITVEVLQNSY